MNRKEPLIVGLLKSIIGHAEGASGATSLARVLLAFENESISANLHLDQIKNTIKPFCPPLYPIRENIVYKPGIHFKKDRFISDPLFWSIGIAAINNLGLGGVNAHAILEPNYKVKTEDNLKIADTIPRIVNICCRTEGAFQQMCKWIEDNPQRISRDFLALLADTMRYKPSINSTGLPYRGMTAINLL